METAGTEKGVTVREVGFCCCLFFGGWKQEFSLGILNLRCLLDIQMEITRRLQNIQILISGEKSGLKIEVKVVGLSMAFKDGIG